jgi:transcriptional regulator with XRE-family HTH domain
MAVNGAGGPVAPDEDEGEHVEPEGQAVLRVIGRQIEHWRTGAGLGRAEFGRLIGYGENLVYKVERGHRIPRPEFLTRSDDVVRAGGRIAAMIPDLEKVRYPRKLPTLIKLERQAKELGAYGNRNIHGLLRTAEYARALFGQERPVHSDEKIEELVRARPARQEIFSREPAVALTFVREEVTLRRPLGGRVVLRRQLERILEVSRLRHVEVQVMPTSTEEHAGTMGESQLVKLREGRAAGLSPGRAPPSVTSWPGGISPSPRSSPGRSGPRTRPPRASRCVRSPCRGAARAGFRSRG